MRTRFAIVLAAAFLGGAPAALHAGEAPGYLRVAEDDGGNRLSLEISIRTLSPEAAGGPVVYLVGVAHIGERAYYERVQSFLDAQDVVLYEGVAPAWTRPLTDDADDDQRRTATIARLRYVGAAAERFRRQAGRLPASPDELLAAAPGYDRRLLQASIEDGWGRPLRIAPGDGGAADVVADDAGLALSAQQPLAEREIAEPPGLQRQLASATGLVFQLDAMDYTAPAWRNSDMTIEQFVGAMTGRDASRVTTLPAGGDGDSRPGAGRFDQDPGEFLAMLSGESAMSRVMGGVLRLLGATEGSRAMFRLVLIEMLSRADLLLEAGVAGEGLTEVLIDARNRVVIDDLAALLDERPDLQSVAIFYGAGHLADLEARLVEDHGYRVDATRWLPAIRFDARASGIPAQQAAMIRRMIATTIDQQLRALGR